MQLEIDARDLERAARALSVFPREMKSALRRALQRSGTHMSRNISKAIKSESFLKAGEIRKALGKPVIKNEGDYMSVEARVASKKLPVDHFKLVPRRVTARKRRKSASWPVSGYQIGPNEQVARLGRDGALSKPFVVRSKGRLMMMRRKGKDLMRLFGYSVQYFAAFEKTREAALDDSRPFFTKTLLHEIEYRLGALK